jgi:acetyltransferase-like isoleucine patch superfamily enzyme
LRKGIFLSDRAGFDEVAEAVWLHRDARLEVDDFSAGPGTVINQYAHVFGAKVALGRECWIDEYAVIGGGSAHDPGAFLSTGDWAHFGSYSHVNIARGVSLGSEVGIGIGTRVFTHGAYLAEWDGYPVSFDTVRIGSRVWMPRAQVNPGVSISDDVVVAAGSIVTTDLPSNSFAAGVPARVKIRPYPPAPPTMDERSEILSRIANEIERISGARVETNPESGFVIAGDTTFSLDARTISGPVSDLSETVRNQLRRRGIRFPFGDQGGTYEAWSTTQNK